MNFVNIVKDRNFKCFNCGEDFRYDMSFFVCCDDCKIFIGEDYLLYYLEDLCLYFRDNKIYLKIETGKGPVKLIDLDFENDFPKIPLSKFVQKLSENLYFI